MFHKVLGIEMCHDDKVIVLIEMRLDLLETRLLDVLNIRCVWEVKGVAETGMTTFGCLPELRERPR